MDERVEQSARVNRLVWETDALRLLLIGQLDDVGGTVIELAAVARNLLFAGP